MGQKNKNIWDIDDCWNRIGVKSHGKEKCPDLAQVGHCRNCPVFCEAGRKQLERPFNDKYQQELVAIYKCKKADKDLAVKNAFIFSAGREWLALPLCMVREVVNIGPIHTIPHQSSRIFRGIVNVRGRLEVCVSIGGVLRIEGRVREKRGFPKPERLIVVAKDDMSVVFPVTEVLGPFRYTPDMVLALPVTISGSKAVYTNGMLVINGKDVGVLDDKLLFRILTSNFV